MATSPEAQQTARTLNTAKIVFFVASAVTPLSAMVGTVPLAFAVGTGPGVPAAYLASGIILGLFGVGYAAMSQHVTAPGAFYVYIARGLGRVPGVAAAYLAVLSYTAFAAGLVGGFAYFARLTLMDLAGVTIPWPWLAAAALVPIALLGRRGAEEAARLLGLLLSVEVGIIAALDAAIIVSKGASAFPTASFSPHNITHGALGVTLAFGFIAYLGFESAALYGREARNPERAVPRSIYASLALITLLYTCTTWLAVGGIGAGHVQQRASAQLGQTILSLASQYVDAVLGQAMEVVLCTSLWSATLSVHNATARYMRALGTDRLLPASLGKTRTSGAPATASTVQILITAAIVGAYAAAGLRPYLSLATSMIGLGTVGIITLQAAAGAAIVVYFRRHPAAAGRVAWWRVLLAPLLGTAGLLAALSLVLDNYAALTGTTAVAVHALPWLVPAAAAAGAAWAWWLRTARPDIYRRIGALDEPTTNAGPTG